MSISIPTIPTTTRIPFVGVAFDSSQAQQGPSLLAYKALLIGQKTAAGTAVADVPVKCTSVDQAILLGGRGSILHRMALGWFASNKSTELWLGVLADNGAGVAATGTIVVTGPATAAGTISLYLGGERVTVGVNSGDISTAIATAIGAAISANLDLPVTASVAGSTVTLTFRHKGLVGNSYDVRHSFRDGEALPAGVGLAITALGSVVAGTTNPSLANLIAAMSDLWFHVWAHPYTDSTNLAAIEAELASRLQPLRMTDGVAVTSAAGTFSALTTLGTARNSPSSVIVAQPGINPLTPPMEFAAETAAIIAYYGQQDPGRPFQTLQYSRAIAPLETDSFDSSERNLMLFDGVATTKRGAGGVVQIERAITTYQLSPAGAADTAYLDVTTPLTLMYLRFSFRQQFLAKYPRHKLGNDVDGNGTPVQYGSGQAVMTPSLGKSEAITWFENMQDLALVEGLEQFKRDLQVVRNPGDPNRLDFLISPDLINGLVVLAASMAFRL